MTVSHRIPSREGGGTRRRGRHEQRQRPFFSRGQPWIPVRKVRLASPTRSRKVLQEGLRHVAAGEGRLFERGYGVFSFFVYVYVTWTGITWAWLRVLVFVASCLPSGFRALGHWLFNSQVQESFFIYPNLYIVVGLFLVMTYGRNICHFFLSLPPLSLFISLVPCSFPPFLIILPFHSFLMPGRKSYYNEHKM